MCTDINHNYGVSTSGIPPMLAVPLAGSVKVAIKDLNGKTFGETTATSQGEWRQTFCLDDGTYVVEFTGVFRPIGIGFNSIYNKPVTSTSITIAVPLTESVDLVPPIVIIGPPGPAGVAGAKGETGPSGIAGITGAEGLSGPSGPSGEEGAQGIAGTDGPQGNSGPQGSQGVVGPDGPPGTTVHRELTGLTIDDHTQYSLVDGSRAFIDTIGGITPLEESDLTTKEYVDHLIMPLDFPPFFLDVSTGLQDVGDIDSIIIIDDADSLDVSEVTGIPGFNIEIFFQYITETPTRLDLHIYYDGSAGHIVNVQIWDQVGSTWDTLGTVPNGGTVFEYLTFDINNGAKYVDIDQMVDVRIYHASAGNMNHDIFLDFAQLRKIPIGGGGSITDHVGLTGLDEDDHNQYALLAGRSSGQTLIGGTDSGDDLVLSSTSDATKGTIDIATSTDTVGIGVTPENRKLEIQDNTNPNAISGSNVDVSELITTFHRANDTNNMATGFGFAISTNRDSIGAAIIHERTFGNSQGKLHFATKSAVDQASDIPIRMTIDEDGRVGVGVTTPNTLANLDVGSGAGVIYYVPTTSEDWAGDGPDGVFEALDELAARNATLPLILTAAGGMGAVTGGAGDVNNLPQRAETSYWGVNYHYLAFATNESAFWNVVMPNNWDGGTMVATFYWTAPSGSDDVKFEIKAGSFANSDALDESLGTEVSIEDTLIDNDDVHITSTTSAMTLAGTPAAGEYCIFQVERVIPEGYDLDGDVHLLSVRLEYAATG